MQMTEYEIRARYKNAADKRTIVNILAQLNATDPDEIKRIVADLTIPERKEKQKMRISSVLDVERLKELHAQGYNDKEISLMLNSHHSTVHHARCSLGLKPNHIQGNKMWSRSLKLN